jgi:hypothetical protein
VNPRFFLRMAKWARNPPSRRRVILVFSILAAALTLVALDRAGLWPEALTLAPRDRVKIHAAP